MAFLPVSPAIAEELRLVVVDVEFDRCDICVLRKLLKVLLLETARRIAGAAELRQRVANIIVYIGCTYLVTEEGVTRGMIGTLVQ